MRPRAVWVAVATSSSAAHGQIRPLASADGMRGSAENPPAPFGTAQACSRGASVPSASRRGFFQHQNAHVDKWTRAGESVSLRGTLLNGETAEWLKSERSVQSA